MKDGGYLIPDDSALSHKIKKMINKELMKQSHKLIKLYEENGVYNFYMEMKVPGSGVEVTRADGSWTPSRAHPWIETNAITEAGVTGKDQQHVKESGFPRQPRA